MPEPKLISPLLDGFVIGEPISDHHGVCCCPALREGSDERYIVKIISIPASQVQLDALLLTGAFSTPAHALSYFEELARDVLSEAETLGKLTRLEGFLPYTGSQLLKMDPEIGYQVYLLSPYKRSLHRHMQIEPLTHLGAVNLSLDLCSALAASRRAGYLYVDLKPNNIFLTETQGWRIGDLGFIPMSSLKYASLPNKYRSEYTAPEICDEMSQLNDTIDIYALGLVLYQVYNNGQLPFEGAAPAEPLPPPAYADYEIAEIILKACHPEPSMRWADPAQMGQAIVDYMQRNSVNDTPIVPPPVEIPPEIPEVPEEEPFLDETENEAALADLMQNLLEEEPPAEEDAPATKEDVSEAEVTDYNDEELDFIIDCTVSDHAVDETVPSAESAADLSDAFVSREVEEMLAQADELISHELPEPAVAPDPIDVPFPPPIILKPEDLVVTSVPDPMADEAPEDGNEVVVESAESTEIDEQNVSDSVEADPILTEAQEDDKPADEEPENEAEDTAEPIEVPAVENAEDDDDDSGDYDDHDSIYEIPESQQGRRRTTARIKILVIIASVLAFLLAVGFGLSFYYNEYYLQHIDSITIEGDVDSIDVQIQSDIDDSLLKVTCIDNAYGIARIEPVKNGHVQFTDLSPHTQYNILVDIVGRHRLIGTTSWKFTTAPQTEILEFTAMAGAEDGSVRLSFIVNPHGPEPTGWKVIYSTPGEAEQSTSFTEHTVTINNLVVGKEYEFRLVAEDGTHLSGNCTIKYTASSILYAQELKVLECRDGVISVTWTDPSLGGIKNWNVRCYNDTGFTETKTTTETVVQFSVPDHTSSYTIEVTAEGMTVGSNLTISANPITITEVKEKVSPDNTITFDWAYTGTAPANGWIVNYSIDNSAAIAVPCETNTVTLPYYPGCHYEVDIAPDTTDVTYLGLPFSYDAPKASEFNKYGVSAEDLSFYMCLTPEREDWDRFDVPREDYRIEFVAGENASFLVEVWTDYTKSDDKIQVSYIVRDKDSIPISQDSETMIWSEMWDNRFCELDIPRLPTAAGRYVVEVYFNGDIVHTEKINIT